jgi:glycerol-3-phosphate dehydrogenase
VLAQVDIAVVGGGVVGCAVAREMVLAGARVALLEKGADILDGASKGNSALLHTGFDAPEGTLEHWCVTRGYHEYQQIHEKLNLPLLSTGALVTAWKEEEEAKFAAIKAKAELNGIKDLKLLSRGEVLAREPHLSKDVRAALHIPGESVIDPWSAPLAYITQAVENGGEVFCSAEVTGGDFDGEKWVLQTARGTLEASFVINCAGLYGDILEQRVFGESAFTIKPRKGQFVVFDKAAGALLNSIILPVPTARTKGVVLFPTIFGNVIAGPTAEEQESRDDTSVDRKTLLSLIDGAVKKMPELAGVQVTATYAGIRSATEESPYRVSCNEEQHWITLGGIRSTGLTGALGLGQHVLELFTGMGSHYSPVKEPVWPKVPNLAEHLQRDCDTPGYGEVVCHCEMVTQREIEAALSSPVPAGSLGGLKRRTRATMGRCQGFYCSARLAELTKNKLDIPLGLDLREKEQ